MDPKLETLRTELKVAVLRGKAITDACAAEKRNMTAEESTEVESALETAREKKAAIEAYQVRSVGGRGQGWKALATSLVETGRGTIRVKDVSVSYDDEVRARQEPGISEAEGIAYDTRYLANVFSSTDPGAALSVTDFRVVSRAVESGSGGSGDSEVLRDPLSTALKSELNVEIDAFTEDLKQLAIMVRGIPNALFGSEPTLSGVLKSQMNKALAASLDAYVLGVIADAIDGNDIETVEADGSSPEELIRSGISAMQAKGIQPTVVVISPGDSEIIDLHTAVDSITRFPFGLAVVVSPDVIDGAPLLLNPAELGHLYKGALEAASDPYTGFARNTTDLRSEYNTLFVLRNADAAVLVTAASGA